MADHMMYPKMDADVANALKPKSKPRPKAISTMFVIPKKSTKKK
jgi:hypothetical protein